MFELYLGKNSFIDSYQIRDTSICDDLIEFWRNSPNQFLGMSFNSNGDAFIDKMSKDSIDVYIQPYEQNPIIGKYKEELQSAVEQYINRFPACNQSSPWSIIETSNIQYYPKGGGYKRWHSERGSCTYPSVTRHLVWMTYLNDVNDQGETEFLYQEVKIKPKKGLTLIWPSDWTHTHRGIPSNSEEKWIITGWFNYINRELQ